MNEPIRWVVCSYRGVLLHTFDTFKEAFDWVGQQYSTSDYYIRRDPPEC